MNLVSMKNDPEEMKDEAESAMCCAPEYPYGLKIDLCDDALEKLGLSDLPKLGSMMLVMAKCEVSSVSSSKDMEGEAENRVCLQITEMAVAQPNKKSPEEALYGKS